jgi:glucose-6-phosphate 1-dehydrogenase
VEGKTSLKKILPSVPKMQKEKQLLKKLKIFNFSLRKWKICTQTKYILKGMNSSWSFYIIWKVKNQLLTLTLRSTTYSFKAKLRGIENMIKKELHKQSITLPSRFLKKEKNPNLDLIFLSINGLKSSRSNLKI